MADDDSAAKAPLPVPVRAPAPGKAVAFKPRPEAVRDLVWRLAADTSNIKWSIHALERMGQRGITDKVALETMRKGIPKGAVEAGQNTGEWKLKMTHRPTGRREVGVVVITVRNARLLVKTVEWEDLT
jgi:hypothetical protein